MIKAHLLAILVFIIPKIGAAADLAIKIPSTETEDWYLRSVNHTVDEFRKILHELLVDPDPALKFANLDLDTGDRVRLGDYALADNTYKKLLERVTSKPGRGIPQELKHHLLEYYEGSANSGDTSDAEAIRLEKLKGMPAGRVR